VLSCLYHQKRRYLARRFSPYGVFGVTEDCQSVDRSGELVAGAAGLSGAGVAP
jgi:hypothetical protein